jgi:hypothetical protein
MEAIAAGLPPADGVAAFNHLYLEVTRAVGAAVAAGSFQDLGYMAALDLTFAGLYFAAVDADGARHKATRCWRPLFEARGDTRVAPIQFALAGMNAHINRDLAVALVETCAARGVPPRRGSSQHADYERIDVILGEVEKRVKAEYLADLVGLGVSDDVLGHLEDMVAIWSISAARDAAWQHAQALWALRDERELYADAVEALDGLVGLAGRGLLAPILEA